MSFNTLKGWISKTWTGSIYTSPPNRPLHFQNQLCRQPPHNPLTKNCSKFQKDKEWIQSLSGRGKSVSHVVMATRSRRYGSIAPMAVCLTINSDYLCSGVTGSLTQVRDVARDLPRGRPEREGRPSSSRGKNIIQHHRPSWCFTHYSDMYCFLLKNINSAILNRLQVYFKSRPQTSACVDRPKLPPLSLFIAWS